MRGTLLWLALAACGSSARPVHHPFQVRQDVREIEYVYPAGRASSFTVCDGMVLVPVNGGISIAGMNAWAVEPAGDPITAVACDGNGGLFVLRGRALLHTGHDGAKAQTIAKLPEGEYTLSDGPAGTAWLWGRTAKGEWILDWTDGSTLATVQTGDQAIGAIADAGSSAVVGAIGKSLVLWRQGAAPQVLLALDAEPDGLAVGPDGSVFVSMPKGVVRIDANHDVVPVATGLHGTLRIRNWTLYVLSNEAARVVRLRPTDVATRLYGPYASDAQIDAAAARLQSVSSGEIQAVARKVEIRQDGGTLGLVGDRDQAMRLATQEMTDHCGPGNFTIVAEGEEETRGGATEWRVHYQCGGAATQP